MTAQPLVRDSRSRAIQIAFFAAVLAAWYAVTAAHRISPLFLPGPVQVAQQIGRIAHAPTLALDIAYTMGTFAIAYTIAVLGGLAAGYIVSTRRFLTRVYEPLLASLYAIPIVVFFPTFILFFGTGPNSKIALGALYAFFPIALNTIAGFTQVDSRLVAAARSMGANDAAAPGADPGRVPDRCDRDADRVHRLLRLDPGRRNDRLRSRARPPNRAGRANDGDCENVRVRDAGRAGRVRIQLRRQRARSAPAAHGMMKVFSAQVASIAVLLLIWEVAARWFIDPQFISPPSKVFVAIPKLFADPQVARAVGTSFIELAVAFAIAVVLGVAIALPVGLSTLTFKSAFPVILLIYAIPQITILPLFVLYFGLGPPSKIAFGASHGIFPIMLNVIAGIRSVRPIYLACARSMGASWLQIVRRIVLPYVLAGLFAGMRLAMSVTLLGVMLAELYVSTAGIGYFTQRFSNEFDATNLLALITVLAIMAVILNETVRRLEARFGRWRRAQR